MFLNASSFLLCSDMDSLWKRNCVSNGSSVIWEILLPSSAINSDDSGFQGPPVSTEIGTKWCVMASVLYLDILFAAALFAAAPVISAVSARWDAAYTIKRKSIYYFLSAFVDWLVSKGRHRITRDKMREESTAVCLTQFLFPKVYWPIWDQQNFIVCV